MAVTPFLIFPVNNGYLQRTTRTPQYGQGNFNSSCLMLFLVPFIAISVFLVAYCVNQFYAGVMLSLGATPIVGQVIERDISEDEGSYSYRLKYQYVVADRIYTYNQQVSDRLYETYQVGQAISITYAAGDATVSRITGVDTTPTNVFLLIFTGIWVFVIGGFTTIFFGAWRRFERLKRDGKLIYGELIEFKGEKDGDGDYQITLRAKFRSPTTLQWVEGKRFYTCNHHLNTRQPDTGTPLAIFYADDKVWEVL